jgi:hypothetical protein
VARWSVRVLPAQGDACTGAGRRSPRRARALVAGVFMTAAAVTALLVRTAAAVIVMMAVPLRSVIVALGALSATTALAWVVVVTMASAPAGAPAATFATATSPGTATPTGAATSTGAAATSTAGTVVAVTAGHAGGDYC